MNPTTNLFFPDPTDKRVDIQDKMHQPKSNESNQK